MQTRATVLIVVLAAARLTAGGILGCGVTPKPVAKSQLPRPTATAATATATATAAFTPADGLTRISLPCAASEREIDNGLDDDCDGAVDRSATNQAPVFVTLSHSALVDVSLALKEGEHDAASSGVLERAHVCEAGAPFSVQTLLLSKLAPGHYELTLTRAATCGAELTTAVDASIWVYGKLLGVYAVSVAPGAATRLGALDVR